MHAAREEAQCVEASSSGFAMGTTCLLIAFLGTYQDGGDALQVGGAGFDIKRKRSDQSVGGVANLAQRNLRVFPPVAARSGGLGTND
jgi:hypothetical protein